MAKYALFYQFRIHELRSKKARAYQKALLLACFFLQYFKKVILIYILVRTIVQ